MNQLGILMGNPEVITDRPVDFLSSLQLHKAMPINAWRIHVLSWTIVTLLWQRLAVSKRDPSIAMGVVDLPSGMCKKKKYKLH
jgi:hypothetical protein